MSNLSDQQARAVVHPAVRPMRNALGLNDWKIHVEYMTLEEGTLGRCVIGLPHLHASIAIDPAQHENEASVLETLRHELLHLLHGYFHHAKQVAEAFADGPGRDVLGTAFELGAEHMVRRLEDLLDSHGLTPEKLAEQ